jgi:hypothetical protein
MQSAKDTLYEVLRTRLIGVNPERTVVLRSQTRPAVIVLENELPATKVAEECFLLSWTKTSSDASGALPLVTMVCEISYATAGTSANSGMDRGRTLAAMDLELMQLVNASPQNAVKTDYSGLAFGDAATQRASRIWWGDVVFGETDPDADRVGRKATVTVMSYQEVGEA